MSTETKVRVICDRCRFSEEVAVAGAHPKGWGTMVIHQGAGMRSVTGYDFCPDCAQRAFTRDWKVAGEPGFEEA